MGRALVPSARSAAVGNIRSVIGGASGYILNPAAVFDLQPIALEVSAGRPFGIDNLNALSISGVLSAGERSRVLLGATYTGLEAFNEQELGAGYAMRLNEQVSIAARLGATNYRIEGYGSTFRPNLTLGAMMLLTAGLQLGVLIENPVPIEVTDDTTMPSVFLAGLSYRLSDNLLLLGEVEKDIDFPAQAKFGIEYYIAEQLALRAGGTTEPSRMHFGFGYRLPSGLSIDFGGSIHQQLGFTPALSIGFLNKQGS